MKVFGLRSYANNDPVTMPFKKTFKTTLMLWASVLIFLISCTKEKVLEKNPSEKLEDYLNSFLKEWQSQNERFQLKLSDMKVVLADENTTDHNLTAVINFPFNWTEFQYQEESDFAQGYDAVIQISSNISITHQFYDGNWSFASASQSDFNATLIDVADDYSKIIADAWLKRLPKQRNFSEPEKLFERIPPRIHQLP